MYSQEFVLLFGFSYFGLKYYGQCWSGATADQTYSRDGPADSCVRGVGVASTYFVYKFYDYSDQGKASDYLVKFFKCLDVNILVWFEIIPIEN